MNQAEATSEFHLTQEGYNLKLTNGHRVVSSNTGAVTIYAPGGELITDPYEIADIYNSMVVPEFEKTLGTIGADIAKSLPSRFQMHQPGQSEQTPEIRVPVKDVNFSSKEKGQQMPDGSIYAGVDEMGEDFFFWLQGIHRKNERMPSYGFNPTTQLLKHYNKIGFKFNGHHFSAFQLDGQHEEDEIRNAIKTNSFDYGLHRPRKDQAELITEIYHTSTEVQETLDSYKSKKFLAKGPCFQTASIDITHKKWHAVQLSNDNSVEKKRGHAGIVIVGRSAQPVQA